VDGEVLVRQAATVEEAREGDLADLLDQLGDGVAVGQVGGTQVAEARLLEDRAGEPLDEVARWRIPGWPPGASPLLLGRRRPASARLGAGELGPGTGGRIDHGRMLGRASGDPA